MRKMIYLSAIGSLLMAFVPAIAEDEGGLEISGNVTLASDYSFRGWSQTTRDPAIQGGFDLDFGNGFAIGTWSSNVKFGGSTSQELDLYVGYSADLSDSVSFSVTAIQFEYPSEGEALDYQEYAFGLDIGGLSLGLVISPEYLGGGGPSFTYFSAGYSLGVSDSASVDLSVGMSSADDDDFFGEGKDSYLDYGISVSMPFSGLDVGISLVGTDVDAGPDTDNRLILSLSKSL